MQYSLTTEWTGNKGVGTTNYRAYDRSYVINVLDKAPIFGSSDLAFRGDKTLHNPEDLLVAALSACHLLWYLHLCSEAGVIVLAYQDNATGIMQLREDGSGYFSEVTLQPVVTVADKTMLELANYLHEQAHKMCFIANSVNFLIKIKPNSRF